jgi:hypothetical protein
MSEVGVRISPTIAAKIGIASFAVFSISRNRVDADWAIATGVWLQMTDVAVKYQPIKKLYFSF